MIENLSFDKHDNNLWEVNMNKRSLTTIILLFFVTVISFAKEVNNGPKLRVTEDMNYYELVECLYKFYELSDFGYCKHIKKEIPKINTQNFLSRTKDEILKLWSKEIAYIRKVYNTPIKQLEQTHLHTEYFPYYLPGPTCRSLTSEIPCCRWHATVLAQRGSIAAQYCLGCVGFNTIQNRTGKRVCWDFLEEDIKWLRIAANNGKYIAYFFMGQILYANKKYVDAVKLYKKGAERGDAVCMAALGDICFKDLKDYNLALDWYQKAAAFNNYWGILQCAEIYSKDSKTFQKAISYYQKLIDIENKNKGDSYKEYIEKYKIEIKKLTK